MPDLINQTPRGGALKKAIVLVVLLVGVLVCFVGGIAVGSSGLSFGESVAALFGNGEVTAVRIVQSIRLPRTLAALIAGAGLAVAGLMMQTTLHNPMASPATLGVSNAAVFGANLAIIGFAGGFLSTGHNVDNYTTGFNPFATSLIAFLFAMGAVLVVLALSKIKRYAPETVILCGIALGFLFTALTTILQFYATDVGLSAAIIWTFGDLGRATFETDWIMLAVVGVGVIAFLLLQWRYNALGLGEEVASSLGVKVSLLRFFTLLVASMITAVIVSFLGIIGFVGVICPHAMRRIIGNNHKFLIPSSVLSGALLVMLADIVSRVVGNGSALPVGAITSLLGAPFFLYLIFTKKGDKA